MITIFLFLIQIIKADWCSWPDNYTIFRYYDDPDTCVEDQGMKLYKNNFCGDKTINWFYIYPTC